MFITGSEDDNESRCMTIHSTVSWVLSDQRAFFLSLAPRGSFSQVFDLEDRWEVPEDRPVTVIARGSVGFGLGSVDGLLRLTQTLRQSFLATALEAHPRARTRTHGGEVLGRIVRSHRLFLLVIAAQHRDLLLLGSRVRGFGTGRGVLSLGAAVGRRHGRGDRTVFILGRRGALATGSAGAAFLGRRSRLCTEIMTELDKVLADGAPGGRFT